MTDAELRAALKVLRLRERLLADRLGVAPNTVHGWTNGDLPVPRRRTKSLSRRMFRRDIVNNLKKLPCATRAPSRSGPRRRPRRWNQAF